ncbi:MAG: glutathionylspermidine synthase family protein [Deltaproteobacteria bacterium]|nr:glutathionylspermidine synthase family protein [Deltaproteobacteria bacterium]
MTKHPHLNIRPAEVENKGQLQHDWLDTANPDEAAYVYAAQGHRLATYEADEYRYYCISQAAFAEIKKATDTLHEMFLNATDFVLHDTKTLERFNLPRSVWPRLRASWHHRKNQMITGRLDFAVSEQGIKIYEYNADSAACYMECGKIQDKWARHFGCTEGVSAGKGLQAALIAAWQKSKIKGIVHVMHDHDVDETYHALYMKSLMERAGLKCKAIKGTMGLSRRDDGVVVDPDGEPIRWVWKTWAWETALDQIRGKHAGHKGQDIASTNKDSSPNLADVLLNEGAVVYEPFWTLITSNKALLPVLWHMYPQHPYLLETQFALTQTLKQTGYIIKPIVGRCGANIQVIHNNHLVLKTNGQFENQHNIYQQYFPLPVINGNNVQISTFTVSGSFAGAVARMNPTQIIEADSNLLSLRVVED